MADETRHAVFDKDLGTFVTAPMSKEDAATAKKNLSGKEAEHNGLATHGHDLEVRQV